MFGDQRPDEAQSACVETEPLDEAVTVFGAPRVRFRIDQPGPRAIVSVKLNDVSPEGESQPVTRARSTSACDGETAVELDLMATGWRFRAEPPDSRSGGGNDWPCLWPLPIWRAPADRSGGADPARPDRRRRAVCRVG